MTTELQDAAVELQQSEAKRAELLPDEVEKAREQLSWVNKMDFSGDRVPPDVDACRKLLAHISALEVENKRLREYHRASEATRPSYQAVSDSWAARDDITKAALAQGAKK